MQRTTTIEGITTWVGSFPSLVMHTLVFMMTLLIGALHIISWDTILLILTTAVSLEAIYLAIFIQMSVNQQSQSIKEIEHDVDEIQEDEQEDEARDKEHQKTLEIMSLNLQKLLEDIEKMKRGV